MERAETAGLAVAIIGHGALAAALVIGLGRAAPPLPAAPVEVSILTEAEAPASPSAEAAQAASAPEPAALTEAPPEPEAVPKPAPKPAPEPKPAPKPAPRPEPRPQPEPAPRPKPAPEPRPAAKAPAKAPTKPAAKPAPKAAATAPAKPAAQPAAKAAAKPAAGPAASAAKRPTTGPTPARSSRLGDDFLAGVNNASEGRAATPPAAARAATPAVQRSLASRVAAAIKPHWRAPQGVEVEQLVSTIAFRLNREGRVIGRPHLVSQTGKTASNARQAPLHAEAAVAAVLKAQPFDLPIEYYEEWQDAQFTFDRKT